MLRFAWRWAQVGDAVLVHDRKHLERELISGAVAVVNRVRHVTSIGIQIDDNGQSRWLWPTPLFVHPDPLDPSERCWICEQNNARSSTPTTSATTKAAAT